MNNNTESDLTPDEISASYGGENESLLIVIDELLKSPSDFAKTIVNEIKALQSRYVLLRLDRDNWRKDYEYERNLSDQLFDCLAAYKNGTATDEEETRKREVVLYEYALKRRGLL